MSKTLIYELPDHEVIEIPVPQEMPFIPRTGEPEVPEPGP